MRPPLHSLQRRLGLLDAASTVVGIILGSGVFVAPAAVVALAPGPGSAALCWLVGGGIALCGALCYAECSARMPQDGGFFVFYSQAWGEGLAHVAGWAAVLLTYPASLAGVAWLGGQYLVECVPALAPYPTWVAFGFLAIAAGVNIWGVRPTAWTQRLLSACKVLALGGLCVAALVSDAPVAASPATWEWNWQWGAALSALSVVMWTYDGWTDVTMIAGEVRDPERTLARAVTVALAILVVLYVLIQAAVLHLLPAAVAAASPRVLADATAAGLGPRAGQAVSWLVVLATASSLHGIMLTCSRLSFAMAQRGALPRVLDAVHASLGTPVRATVQVAVCAVAFLAVGSFEQLVSFFSFTIWIFYGLTAVALVRLRRAGIGEPLPWRAPGGLLPPTVLMAAAIVLTTLQIGENPRQCAIGVGVLTLAAGIYRLQKRLAQV